MNHQFLLNDFIIEKHVKNALEEDIGYGDITTDFLYSDSEFLTAYLNTRADGVICGLPVFKKFLESSQRMSGLILRCRRAKKSKKARPSLKLSAPQGQF